MVSRYMPSAYPWATEPRFAGPSPARRSDGRSFWLNLLDPTQTIQICRLAISLSSNLLHFALMLVWNEFMLCEFICSSCVCSGAVNCSWQSAALKCHPHSWWPMLLCRSIHFFSPNDYFTQTKRASNLWNASSRRSLTRYLGFIFLHASYSNHTFFSISSQILKNKK